MFEKFQKQIDRLFPSGLVGPVAVAVSGGPDSMALLKLLSDAGIRCHALIVDHGLRDDSAEEAAGVAAQIKGWSGVQAHILTWDAGVDTRIQEQARQARYELMASHCGAHKIIYLFLGHHMDDQAETFLFRLAKGSGLDGLAAMKPLQYYDEHLTLVRPLLVFPKADLVAFCKGAQIDFIDDPSNESEEYVRVRLRGSAHVLAREGLSAKRLSVTARRMARARAALEVISGDAFDRAIINLNSKRIEFNIFMLRNETEEIGLRVILKAIKTLQIEKQYLPRMEKLEDLFDDLMHAKNFRKRTLGGLIFERDDKNNNVIIERENA